MAIVFWRRRLSPAEELIPIGFRFWTVSIVLVLRCLFFERVISAFRDDRCRLSLRMCIRMYVIMNVHELTRYEFRFFSRRCAENSER